MFECGCCPIPLRYSVLYTVVSIKYKAEPFRRLDESSHDRNKKAFWLNIPFKRFTRTIKRFISKSTLYANSLSWN